MEARHSIKAVATRTGLTPHVIRIWERRYGAVVPTRTATNRRLYSDADIDRLRLLRRATQAGESIGQVADLSNEELAKLIGETPLPMQEPSLPQPTEVRTASEYVSIALEAVAEMDGHKLETTLLEASVQLGQTQLLDNVLQPLLTTVGERWLAGEIRMAHEHFASAIVRTILGGMLSGGQREQSAPRLVTTTLSGHNHELGALMVAATAAASGWRPIYLGADLPIEDIARAVRQSRARVCAISIVYPPDDPRVAPQLEKLRRLIGDEVKLLVGGRSAAQYQGAIATAGGVLCGSVHDLGGHLEDYRFEPSKSLTSDGTSMQEPRK